jgi:hypothetical protein
MRGPTSRALTFISLLNNAFHHGGKQKIKNKILRLHAPESCGKMAPIMLELLLIPTTPMM